MIADPNAMPEPKYQTGETVIYDKNYLQQHPDAAPKPPHNIKTTIVSTTVMMKTYIYEMIDEDGIRYTSMAGMGITSIKENRDNRLNTILD